MWGLGLRRSAPGAPRAGKSFFFSVGDFGVAACARAFAEGDLEEKGGIGHEGCVAEHQRRGARRERDLNRIYIEYMYVYI